jgi:hypothetical protein
MMGIFDCPHGFSVKENPLIHSPFTLNENEGEGTAPPPPTGIYMITETGDNMITETGNNLMITE